MTDPNGLLFMRARYYNPYICRFLSADPSGFAGGLNHYAYANGNPVSYLDPFGLGAVGESSDSSWLAAGQGLMGLGNSVANTGSSLWNAATSPIDTASSLVGNVLDYPYETSQAIGNSVANTWNNLTGSDPYLQGQAVGNVATTIAMLASPFAEADATQPTITVLGSRADVAPYIGQPGFNTFTGAGIAPAELDSQNALWLNNAIQNGDTIWQVTDPVAHQQFLNTLPGNPQSAYLNLEIPMLNEYQGVNILQKFATH